MRKILKNESSEESVTLCKKCKVICDYHSNDWDSFHECPECGADNFTSNLATIDGKKIITYKEELTW